MMQEKKSPEEWWTVARTRSLVWGTYCRGSCVSEGVRLIEILQRLYLSDAEGGDKMIAPGRP